MYGLVRAMDWNETAPGVPGSHRNPFIMGEDRLKILVMDPGPVQISGISVNTEGEEGTYRMQGRVWQSMDMALGHVRIDESGTLLSIRKYQASACMWRPVIPMVWVA